MCRPLGGPRLAVPSSSPSSDMSSPVVPRRCPPSGSVSFRVFRQLGEQETAFLHQETQRPPFRSRGLCAPARASSMRDGSARLLPPSWDPYSVHREVCSAFGSASLDTGTACRDGFLLHTSARARNHPADCCVAASHVAAHGVCGSPACYPLPQITPAPFVQLRYVPRALAVNSARFEHLRRLTPVIPREPTAHLNRHCPIEFLDTTASPNRLKQRLSNRSDDNGCAQGCFSGLAGGAGSKFG